MCRDAPWTCGWRTWAAAAMMSASGWLMERVESGEIEEISWHTRIAWWASGADLHEDGAMLRQFCP